MPDLSGRTHSPSCLSWWAKARTGEPYPCDCVLSGRGLSACADCSMGADRSQLNSDGLCRGCASGRSLSPAEDAEMSGCDHSACPMSRAEAALWCISGSLTFVLLVLTVWIIQGASC